MNFMKLTNSFILAFSVAQVNSVQAKTFCLHLAYAKAKKFAMGQTLLV